MTDRLPPELESMDALLKRTLPKEPMEGLTPAQLAGLRQRVGAKRRSKKWLWAAVTLPVLAASAALFLYGNDAARESDSYMAAEETKYAGIEEDAAPEDVAAEAASDAEAEGKPAAKPTTQVAAAKKPAAKVAQVRRQNESKNEGARGSASLKGLKVGQGKPTTGSVAGPSGAKADRAARKESAAAPAATAPAKPSGGFGLAKPKAQGSLGKLGEIGMSDRVAEAKREQRKKKASKSIAGAQPAAPGPVSAGVTVAGALPRDIVTRLVRAADPKLRACFANYSKRAGAGAVTHASLSFTITPDGKVTATSAVVTDNAFRACLKNEAGRWTFPAAKQKTKVGVRLSFKP